MSASNVLRVYVCKYRQTSPSSQTQLILHSLLAFPHLHIFIFCSHFSAHRRVLSHCIKLAEEGSDWARLCTKSRWQSKTKKSGFTVRHQFARPVQLLHIKIRMELLSPVLQINETNLLLIKYLQKRIVAIIVNREMQDLK